MSGSYRSSQPPPAAGRVLTEDLGRVFLISIDRTHKNNSFTPKMLNELAEAFTTYELTDQYWCALLYAQGDHFTTGLDLETFDLTKKLINEELLDPFGINGPTRTKPLIAAVQGNCFSLGVELVLASDIIIASGDTRFALQEAGRGMMPLFGATIRLVERLGWSNAMQYLLTGDEFTAPEALRLGLVQEIVADASVFTHALSVAERVARRAPLAVKATLESANVSVKEGAEVAFDLLRQQIRQLVESDDYQEGLGSLSKQRDARFRGR